MTGAGSMAAMASMFDLTGRAAIVTGGNGGIGLGMARGLASAGAHVLVAGRDAEKNRAAVAELGGEAAAFRADLTQPDAARAMVDDALARWGRLDVLVNNAGTNIRKRPEDLSLEEWGTVLNINLTAAFLCSRAAFEPMRRARAGKIVNIGSMMSIFGAPFTPAYAASKGGIVQLTKATATAWAEHGIQVNAVLPGWIDTALTRRGRREVPGLHERVLARTPAGRWGVPDDLSGVAVFLAAPASDFVTGAALPVDGGFSAQS